MCTLRKEFWIGRRGGLWRGLLLAALVLWGVGVRVNNLEARSLWIDELFTLAIAQYHPFWGTENQPAFRRIQVTGIADGDSFLTAKAAEQSPPLNDILEKLTVTWMGATEAAARLPAAISAGVMLFWYAGFSLLHRDQRMRRVLIWATYLLTLYPVLTLYAKEGRAYSIGVSLIGMAGLLWMLRWCRGTREWSGPGWVEIGMFTLACYSHYNAAVVVMLLQLPDALMAIERKARDTLLRIGVGAGVFGLWIIANFHAIVFTASGGVAWPQGADQHGFIPRALLDAAAVIQTQWLCVAILVLSARTLWRRAQEQTELPTEKTTSRVVEMLGVVIVLYIILAAGIAAAAGIGHPRYYIFVTPLLALLMATVFADLRHCLACLFIVLLCYQLSDPSLRLLESSNNDDFRSMSVAAVVGASSETSYLYALPQLRDVYRVSLHRYLGRDPLLQMTSIPSEQEVLLVCQQLQGKAHVVALGHVVGLPPVNAVYKACGTRWPNRTYERFHNTFTEHWRMY